MSPNRSQRPGPPVAASVLVGALVVTNGVTGYLLVRGGTFQDEATSARNAEPTLAALQARIAELEHELSTGASDLAPIPPERESVPAEQFVTELFEETETLKRQGLLRQGRESGAWATYHPNGKKESEGSYIDGLRSGPWVFWDKNGELLKAGSFVDDKREGPWVFYKLGAENSVLEVTYHQGEPTTSSDL